MIDAFVDAGYGCEIGPMLDEFGIPEGKHCRGVLEGLHERRKRGQGGSLIIMKNLVPACNFCNGWVEDSYPLLEDEQKALFGTTLVVHDGDPEWASLGRKAED